MDYLFVYGTLMNDKNSAMSDFLKANAVLVGEGYFHGKLYRVSWYPAAIKSNNENEKVFGEVYKLNTPKKTLLKLDFYEGIGSTFPFPHEYSREIVNIYTHNSSDLNCWVYLFNKSVEGLKCIESGKY